VDGNANTQSIPDRLAALEAKVEQLGAAITLLEEVTSLRADLRERKSVDDSKQLLSQREAARILGVDRKTTLRNLIKDGAIRTVDGTRGLRSPAPRSSSF